MTRTLMHLAAATTLLATACAPKPQLSLPTADNSETSVDWPGTYYGKLPCADCEGIETTINLLPDKTYTAETLYAGKENKPQESSGTFRWDKGGSVITLSSKQSSPATGQYQVGENRLFRLDQQGKRITGNLATSYELAKDLSGLAETSWELTELMGKPVTSSFEKTPGITFKANSRVVANGGCNNMMGSYTSEGMDRIRFGQMAATMMACPNMTIEQELAKVLETADNYTIADGVLSLNKARMAPLARFKKAGAKK